MKRGKKNVKKYQYVPTLKIYDIYLFSFFNQINLMDPFEVIKTLVNKNNIIITLTLPVIFIDQFILKYGSEFVFPSLNYSSIEYNIKKREFFQ